MTDGNNSTKKWASNHAAITAFLSSHLGATQKDVMRALGLSKDAVSRHVRALRREWMVQK
jgi:DNA-binding MarR family transcriptional regulator